MRLAMATYLETREFLPQRVLLNSESGAPALPSNLNHRVPALPVPVEDLRIALMLSRRGSVEGCSARSLLLVGHHVGWWGSTVSSEVVGARRLSSPRW